MKPHDEQILNQLLLLLLLLFLLLLLLLLLMKSNYSLNLTYKFHAL